MSYQVALFEAGVSEFEFDNCMTWAFGEGYGAKNPGDGADWWNEHHSDIFVLQGHDDIYRSLVRIGKAYLEKRKNGSIS